MSLSCVQVASIVYAGLSIILQFSIQTCACLEIIINNYPGTIYKWTSSYMWVGELIFITVRIFGKTIRKQQISVSTAANLLCDLEK
jgi:hypothetical protein